MTSQARWVEDQAHFDDVIGEVAKADAYAIDTEFHRERTYFPHLALLQLGWSGGIAVVDPYTVDLAPLARVLEGPGLAVVHAAEQDLEVLRLALGVAPSRLFDTQVAAGFLGLSSPSLLTLVERLLERTLPKGDRLTDWTRRPLTEEQRDYAAADVEHLLDLREEIERRLRARGRLEWAEDECRLVLERSTVVADPETAWWRLKEARQLRGRSRGVAQEVAAWRERRAAATDVPARFVLPDLAVGSIAQRPPSSRAELRAVRGMDGRGGREEVADEVLAAVRRGRDLAPEQLRLPPTDHLERTLRPAVILVSAWVGQLAADLQMDPALLATRADLVTFLRGDSSARLANGWRHELIGEPVRALVSGEAALAFAGSHLVLEERSYRGGRSTTASDPSSEPL